MDDIRMNNIRVELLENSTFQVNVYYFPADLEVDAVGKRHTLFQGSLAECEAWIRLYEKGYLIP